MNNRLLLWFAPALIWLLFTLWYTDFGGPLSDEEIAVAVRYFESRDIDPEFLQTLKTFMETDSGRQFLMVNNIDMNTTPPAMPGFDAAATAEDYMNHYMEYMYRELFLKASHPVFYAAAVGPALDLVGIEGGRHWSASALFRYRSRRTFLEIIMNPQISARHAYKIAALSKTIAYPVEPRLYMSDPRFLLFLILGFATALIDGLVLVRKIKRSKRSSRPANPV